MVRSRRQDHYGTLGLRRSASKDEVRKRFKELALKWHPDKIKPSFWHRDPEKRFLAIREAHDVLAHDGKRAAYDADLERRSKITDWWSGDWWSGDWWSALRSLSLTQILVALGCFVVGVEYVVIPILAACIRTVVDSFGDKNEAALRAAAFDAAKQSARDRQQARYTDTSRPLRPRPRPR